MVSKPGFLISILLVAFLSAHSVSAAGDRTKNTGLPGASPAVAARVYQLSGTVQFKPADGTAWYKPAVKMALHDGDTIRTGADGWLALVFENASIIRVAAGSELVISRLKFDASSRSIDAVLKIPGTGKLLAVIRKLEKKNNSLDIYTPLAVAGVRGTDLMVDSTPVSTVVAVFEGKIIVKDLVGEQGFSTDDNAMMLDFLRQIMVSSGRMTTYKKDSGLKKSRPIGSVLREEKTALQSMKLDSQKLEKELSSETARLRAEESERIRTETLR